MRPLHGFGLGLRTVHYSALHALRSPRLDWLEIVSENYMVPGGAPLWHLERLRRDYPVVMHGVSLNIGGNTALDADYLRGLHALVQRIEPALVSDHLCWTGLDGLNLHDLLPLPYTEASLRHVCSRIAQVQDALGRTLLLENPSTYVGFAGDEMPEWEFVGEMVRRSGCELLLDVNNVHVSSTNHGWDARAYIDAIDPATVRQIHLAGHEVQASGLLIDTHDQPVCPEVWDLYAYTIERMGAIPTMIERDDHIPALDVLLDELDTARAVAASALPACQEAA